MKTGRAQLVGGGFTLVEALLGSLILALSAVVICGLSSRCLQNTQRGLYYEQGYRLLDECLETLMGTDLAKLAKQGMVEGDFGDRHVGYRYVIEIKPSESIDLYEVTATVRWMVAGSAYEVRAQTLLYDFGD